jgi:hypothetical protein
MATRHQRAHLASGYRVSQSQSSFCASSSVRIGASASGGQHAHLQPRRPHPFPRLNFSAMNSAFCNRLPRLARASDTGRYRAASTGSVSAAASAACGAQCVARLQHTRILALDGTQLPPPDRTAARAAAACSARREQALPAVRRQRRRRPREHVIMHASGPLSSVPPWRRAHERACAVRSLCVCCARRSARSPRAEEAARRGADPPTPFVENISRWGPMGCGGCGRCLEVGGTSDSHPTTNRRHKRRAPGPTSPHGAL